MNKEERGGSHAEIAAETGFDRRRAELELGRLKLERQKASIETLLKRRELRASVPKQWKELFANPLALAIVGGFITLMTTIIAGHLNASDTLNAEKTKSRELLQADLLKKFVDNPDPSKVRANLQFLVDVGLVPDYTDSINSYLKRTPDSELPDLSYSGLSTFKSGAYYEGTENTAQVVTSQAADLATIPLWKKQIIMAEGRLFGNTDSVNTYDLNFMSFGSEQWNVAHDEEPGTLPGLLAYLKNESPKDFARIFGNYGIDVAITHVDSRPLASGYLMIDGKRLDSAQSKQELRNPKWAKIFAEAGKDSVMKRVEIEVEADTIDVVCRLIVRDRQLVDWVNSEFGVALLFDQYLNRPGQLNETLSDAIGAFVQKTSRDNPATWTDADEEALIKLYREKRGLKSMTDSDHRAEILMAAVKQGQLSSKRGSVGKST